MRCSGTKEKKIPTKDFLIGKSLVGIFFIDINWSPFSLPYFLLFGDLLNLYATFIMA